eukprot:scaffold14589_cov106-Cylindrotheca_fusiformis.AAC.5
MFRLRYGTCLPVDHSTNANRGEIAARVIRTCRALQIPTVALYSVADGPNALHAKMADESYCIGTGPSATESYLLQEEIVQIAQDSGAQAIHPGYGFLSEHAGFCQHVSDTPGLVFVGPGPDAITAMGSKSQSKAIMEKAGVPTTPGYYGDDTQEPEQLRHEAVQIGFPLLIKAVMGGGGKGMRLVWKEEEFLEKLESCQRESQQSFGDSRVLLEKYLVNPRHVEVQIIADQHGNVVHLHERDCSLQRRHQKIIEEAPAGDLPMELRERLGEMGKKAALAAGYVNAGTVEFLLDTQQPDQFYFCEMNTRLQVEHPITECITGIDLVEWQLRIAAGEELPIREQANIPCHGHAFEARIYAENPARNFLPATGTVWHHTPPATPNGGMNPSSGIRVDTGIQKGQEVGVYYDPMICKLIVHDEDRPRALQKLVTALKDYQIAGVPTNIEFLVKCAEHDTFQTAGAIHTGFLNDHLEDVQVEEGESTPTLAAAIGAFASLLHLEGRYGIEDLGSARRNQMPWSSLSGSWRMGGPAVYDLELADGTSIKCTCHRDGSYDIFIGPYDEYHIDGTILSNGEMEVVVNKTKRISIKSKLHDTGDKFEIRMWPQHSEDYFWHVDVQNPINPVSQGAQSVIAGHGTVKAPMPGKISRINAKVGDYVKAGDILVVMEAMKMEHAIEAPVSGTVVEMHFKVDDVVQDGVDLALVQHAEVDEAEESEAIS